MAMETQSSSARLTKPSWKDPRLMIGILLVLASVVSVVALVTSAGKTVPAYVATDVLVVGQKVTAESLTIVQVQLGDADGKYLDPNEVLDQGAVAIRMVPKGELVSRSSIGNTDALDRKPASVTIDEPLPKEVVVGSRVDVWVALPDERNGYQPPVLMLPGAEVAALNVSSSSLGSGKNMQLMVLVTDVQMPKFLGAVANKAKVAVVWNPGAAP
ncbi:MULTISPECIES: SAF domain-containing protein [Arthrobacter]|uniref:SAF domain-containing protein n=1 Tax=unclassified Arthrobacter TaxID=235627 RepID=UPI0024B9C5FB|nr:SAF domain-containing protein [Arthrobacter sp. H35-MC1]MDJ0316496.1 SAF domain-containing protein [Arthrobacter sp. H35-MC1]